MLGKWSHGFFERGMVCDLPTPDAGKVCRDDAECTLYCKPDSHSAWGKDSLGTCETHTYFLGCIHGMVHGKPATGPCMD